jgi:RNA polymerase sigma-70 factor (sigma-E family)
MERENDDGNSAFDEFVGRRYAGFLRTAYLLTGDRGLAEDLVQTALFKTYKRWSSLRDQADPTAYVRRAMVTTQTSWMRRRSSGEQVVEIPDGKGGVEDPSTADRLHMRLALGELPPRMRAVVVLRFYEDLSEAETARLLGCSVGTVKTQTSRGLDRLRTVLGTDDAVVHTPRTPTLTRKETS